MLYCVSWATSETIRFSVKFTALLLTSSSGVRGTIDPIDRFDRSIDRTRSDTLTSSLWNNWYNVGRVHRFASRRSTRTSYRDVYFSRLLLSSPWRLYCANKKERAEHRMDDIAARSILNPTSTIHRVCVFARIARTSKRKIITQAVIFLYRERSSVVVRRHAARNNVQCRAEIGYERAMRTFRFVS